MAFSQPTNLVVSPIEPQYNTDAPPQLIKVASSLQEVPSTLGIGYQVKWDNGDGINLNGCTVVWETTYGVMYSGVQYSNPDAKTSTLTTNPSQGYVRWVNAKEYPVANPDGSTTYVARGKIKVTYSGSNCSANGKTATKDVNIRFVGNPGAVTITGYSNPATVTCGAKNITLTVTHHD
ncbi:hypothetical protein SAMN05216327_10211 [Dyadobacter sp. SG02]|nr:hypothetical protein SAMN05216327_10211 [Dyadobacter sp. SG02]